MNRSPQGSLIPLALLCLVAGGLLAYFIQPAWIGLVVCLLALVFLFVGMAGFPPIAGRWKRPWMISSARTIPPPAT